MNILGLLPMRGNSERLPDKNLSMLGGHPLCAWPLEAAHQSGRLDRMVVATDSPRIAAVAEQYGAEVPFLLPPELTAAGSIINLVYRYVMQKLEEHEGWRADWVVQLQATAPFVVGTDIAGVLDVIDAHPDAEHIAGIARMPIHPYDRLSIAPSGRVVIVELGYHAEIELLAEDRGNVQRDAELDTLTDLRPPCYWGQPSPVAMTRDFVERQNVQHSGRMYPYHMSALRGTDINTAVDLRMAQALWAVREEVEDMKPVVQPRKKKRVRTRRQIRDAANRMLDTNAPGTNKTTEIHGATGPRLVTR